MSRYTADVVARLTATTLQYNREILGAVKVNTELLKSMQNVKQESTKTGDDFVKSGIKMGTIIYTLRKVTNALLDLGDASSRAQEIQQKFDVVFKHNRAEVQAWADQLADNFNRSSTEIEAMAAHLQNTFVPLGFMRDEAEELSKQMVQLTLDLSSFNDVPTSRVVDDIRSALLGNIRAVRKYGVSANETAIRQEALNNGWIRERENIDAVTKARAINNIILRSTVDAQGDLERTMMQTANVRRSFNQQITRSKEILGDYVNFGLTPIRFELARIIEKYNQAREAHLDFLKFERGQGEVYSPEKALADTLSQIENLQGQLANIEQKGIRTQLFGQEAYNQSLRDRIEYLEGNKRILEQIIELQGIRAAKLKAQEEAEAESDARAEYRAKLFLEIEQRLGAVNEQQRIANELGEEYNATEERAKVIQDALNKVTGDYYDTWPELINDVIRVYDFLIARQQISKDATEAEKLAAKEAQEAEEDRLEVMEKEAIAARELRREMEAQKNIIDLSNLSDSFSSISGDLQDLLEELSALNTESAGIAVNFINLIDNIASFAIQAGNIINTIISDVAILIETQLNRELEEFAYAEEEKAKLRKEEYDDKVAKINEEIADKELRDNALLALEEEYRNQEAEIAEENDLIARKMEYEAELQAWKLKLLSTIASGALAITNAFATPPAPVGIALGSLMSTLVGVQLGIVKASKPVKNFQTGTSNFIVPEGYPNDSFQIGLSSGERFSVDTPTQQIDPYDAFIQNIYFMIDSKQIGKVVNRGIRQRDIIVRAKDIVG